MTDAFDHLYQGPGQWTVSRQFLDWLAVPEELKILWRELQAQLHRRLT